MGTTAAERLAQHQVELDNVSRSCGTSTNCGISSVGDDDEHAVRRCAGSWASVPVPPSEDLKYLAWGWVRKPRAPSSASPRSTSISTLAASPRALRSLDLPPRAAAAYLGSFLMSLLKGLEFQQATGIFDDVLSRAHTLTCLTLPEFLRERPDPAVPSPQCRDVLAQVVTFLVAEREALALTQEQVDVMVALVAER